MAKTGDVFQLLVCFRKDKYMVLGMKWGQLGILERQAAAYSFN